MQSPTSNQNAAPFLTPMTLKELAELLIKEKNLHEGLFDLAFEFQIAVGGVGPTTESLVPGAMIGVSRVGLTQTQQVGPHTVDAALVNPAQALPKKRKITTK